jgi:hypothetical protein
MSSSSSSCTDERPLSCPPIILLLAHISLSLSWVFGWVLVVLAGPINPTRSWATLETSGVQRMSKSVSFLIWVMLFSPPAISFSSRCSSKYYTRSLVWESFVCRGWMFRFLSPYFQWMKRSKNGSLSFFVSSAFVEK